MTLPELILIWWLCSLSAHIAQFSFRCNLLTGFGLVGALGIEPRTY